MEEFDIIPVIKELIEAYKEMQSEIDDMKGMLMDNLIAPLNEAYEKDQHDIALSDFRCKHAEKLEPFGEKLKSLEGDDFDIIEKAFDNFSSRTDGMDEDEYVDRLAEKVSSQLDAISKAFGVAPEEVESISVETEDGEKKVEVEDGEVVGSTEAEVEEPKTEEPKTEEEKERPEGATDTPDDDEENRKYWESFLKEE